MDACNALIYLIDDEDDIVCEDAEHYILQRDSFAASEVSCAWKAILSIEPESPAIEPALHILSRADPSGAQLDRGLAAVLRRDPTVGLRLLCRYVSRLPERLSQELCEAVLANRGRAVKTLYFDRYLFVFRPLARRCQEEHSSV